MKKTFGYILLATPFAVIFVGSWVLKGPEFAIVPFLATALIVGCIFGGLYLTSK